MQLDNIKDWTWLSVEDLLDVTMVKNVHCDLYLYADDSVLLVNGKGLNNVWRDLETENNESK